MGAELLNQDFSKTTENIGKISILLKLLTSTFIQYQQVKKKK